MITFHVVCLAWIFFRSPDLSTAFDMIGQVFAGGPSPLVTLPMVFLVVAAIGLQAVPGDFWEAEAWLVARPVVVQGWLLGAIGGRRRGRRPGGRGPVHLLPVLTWHRAPDIP